MYKDVLHQTKKYIHVNITYPTQIIKPTSLQKHRSTTVTNVNMQFFKEIDSTTIKYNNTTFYKFFKWSFDLH